MTERELMRRLVHDLKPAKIYLIWSGLLYIPVTILSVIQPVIIGYAIQHGIIIQDGLTIVQFSLIFAGAILLLSVCEWVQGLTLQISGQILVSHLRQKAFEKMQRLSMGFLDSTPLGKLLTRVTNDAESVAEMFSMGAVQIFGDSLFLIGTFIMLLFVDIKLSLYSALILPVVGIGVYFFRIWTKKSYVKIREVLSSFNGFLQEYLSGMATVQISGRIDQAHDDFASYNQLYLVTNRQAVVLDAAIYSFVDAISYVATALVLWGAFRLNLDHALSLGVLVAFIEALSRFFQPVRELSNRYAIFQSALVSLERMYHLFDWPEENDSFGSSPRPFINKIEFNHVSFAYKNNEPVLKDISFTLEKGKRIALVGHTGSGKSTVIKLLNRFYPVAVGEILVDGRNINDMSLSELRKLVSVVPQEAFLFKGSLRDNLTFGNHDATDEELWRALELTQLHETIEKKGGLKAKVLAAGANFSVGERQLLAIARAIVTNPPILVLDEATANVDVMTESRLQIATSALLKGRTALVIAHRLSTIMDADHILVFNRGHIVEHGNHEQLIEQNGMYAGLIRIQALTEEEDNRFQSVI